MLGFDRALADPELLDVAAESERHAEDGDVASLGALVTSWLGLGGEQPAVLQLDDGGKSEPAPPARAHAHLPEITELPEIPEMPEPPQSADLAAEVAATAADTAAQPPSAAKAPAVESAPANVPAAAGATSPTFRERLAGLLSRLQSPSAATPAVSVLSPPPPGRPAAAPAVDRRASAVSSQSLDETDAAIPPPSYTLGRPDPIVLSPGLLHGLSAVEPADAFPDWQERRRKSGVTTSPPLPLLECVQLRHSQYRVRRARAGGGGGGGPARTRADDRGRF